MRDVLIDREPVELYKILKFEGLAENGGAAKIMVSEGMVKVNQAVETRKRRKIMAGDVIECQGQRLHIVRAVDAAAEEVAAEEVAGDSGATG